MAAIDRTDVDVGIGPTAATKEASSMETVAATGPGTQEAGTGTLAAPSNKEEHNSCYSTSQMLLELPTRRILLLSDECYSLLCSL